MKIIEEAKSKINISLNLTGKKENNFHQLLSFICFSNFSDQLILTKSDFFDYETHSPFQKIPKKDDLVLKTIDTIKKYLKLTDLPPFKLVLKKNIPLGSGLGGGSADSAALIRLLNNFLDLNLCHLSYLCVILMLSCNYNINVKITEQLLKMKLLKIFFI